MLARLALGNVRKSLRDFGVYFLTVVLGVAVFYAFNSMTAQQGVLALSETQDRMFDLLGDVYKRQAQDLAALFHSFYTNCHVINEESALRDARLALVDATRIVLALSLGLLGVSAPAKM